MNLPIIEAIRCSGILTPLFTCVRCKYHLGLNYQSNEINCGNENGKKTISRKELYEDQCKEFYKDGGMIEFGEEGKRKENKGNKSKGA